MANNLIALSLFFFALVAEGAPIYKWVDDQGATHYSASPPPNQKAMTLKAPASPAASAGDENASSAQARQENELDLQMRRAAQQEKKNREEALAINEANARNQKCLLARRNLGTLQVQGRIYKFNEKGEKVYWDDAFHDAEIERMKKLIELNCDAP